MACLLYLINSICFAGDEWLKKADMPTPRGYMSASAVDGKIYLIGGFSNSKYAATVEEYDLNTGTWIKKADMLTPRAYLCTSVVNGKIYAMGGSSEEDRFGLGLSTNEEYDPKTDKWTKKADMPTRRRIFSTTVVDGKIYAIGGSSDVYLPTVEVYDPINDEWTRKKDMPAVRTAHSCCSINGKIYVIGGIGIGGLETKDADAYDPKTNKWEKVAKMTVARFGLCTSVVNDKIYAIGGGFVVAHNNFITRKSIDSVEEYDPESDKWIEKTEMPTPRFFFAQEVVDRRIYTFGGLSDLSVILSDLEEYTPEGWPFSVSPEGNLVTTWGEMKQK